MNLESRNSVPKRPEEGLVAGSKESVVIKNLQRKLEGQGVELASLSEEEVSSILATTRMIPGVTTEQVLAAIKKSGLIASAPVKKAVLPPSEKVSLKTTLSGITAVSDPEIARLAAERLREEALRKERRQSVEALEKDIFTSSKDLDLVYVQALSLGSREEREKPQHYYDFADAGLIKGGHEEVDKDLADTVLREEQFKKKYAEIDPEYAMFAEKNAKIATIVEQALAYSVSELGWYGENVKVSSASRFDDVKRGVDDVLEITKKNEDDKYLGLGIDVTYNGLQSERYKDKFERLLESIRVGQKTKIKYFKNQKGEPMPEFVVPKIVLHFKGVDVKELAHFVRNFQDPVAREALAKSPMKASVINQVIVQCEILADFADEFHNSIALKYRSIMNAISELATKDIQVKEMLTARTDNETSLRLKQILSKFKEIEVYDRIKD
jgi:hypothetical protein